MAKMNMFFPTCGALRVSVREGVFVRVSACVLVYMYVCMRMCIYIQTCG